MISCRKARTRMLRACDDALGLEQGFELEEHLRTCEACARLKRRTERLDEALARRPQPPLEHLDVERLVAGVRAACDRRERDRLERARRRARRLAAGAIVLALGASLVLLRDALRWLGTPEEEAAPVTVAEPTPPAGATPGGGAGTQAGAPAGPGGEAPTAHQVAELRFAPHPVHEGAAALALPESERARPWRVMATPGLGPARDPDTFHGGPPVRPATPRSENPDMNRTQLLSAPLVAAAALASSAAGFQNGFTVRPGWPLTLTGSSVDGGLLIDMDGDPELELVQVTGSTSTSNVVHVLNPDASYVPGWPKSIDPNFGTFSAPAGGDIDGDGAPEIVLSSFKFGLSGKIWALNPDGSVVSGFPYVAGGPLKGPALGDLDLDGSLEIAALSNVSGVGQVNVLDGSGASLPGWPQVLDSVSAAAPAIGDLDGDGTPEIVAVSYTTLYAFRTDGTLLPNFPMQFAGQVFNYNAPVLVDIDGDGDREIVQASCGQGGGGAVRVIDHDGTVQTGWPKALSYETYTPPSVADIDGDGFLDIAIGDQILNASPINQVYAWDRFGNPLPGFPITPVDAVFSQIVVADIDGDSQVELVFDGNVANSPLMAYNHDGTPVSGWPMAVQGSSWQQTPSVADVDGDGLLDMAGSGNLISAGNTVVYMWTTTFAWDEDLAQVPTYQYGPERSGVVDGGGAAAPTFCTSKPSSLPGCTPALTAPGLGIAKGGSAAVTANVAPAPGGGNPGILIYSRSGELTSPVQTQFGFLCISSFFRASSFAKIPGGTLGQCDGAYVFDLQGIVNLAPALQAGDSLWLQCWYRDPASAPGQANFTNGVGPIAIE